MITADSRTARALGQAKVIEEGLGVRSQPKNSLRPQSRHSRALHLKRRYGVRLNVFQVSFINDVPAERHQGCTRHLEDSDAERNSDDGDAQQAANQEMFEGKPPSH